MERTEVFELVTEADVEAFCQCLRASKELAPASLRYTVALTASRKAKVLQLYSEVEARRSPIESSFHRLVGL